MMASNVTFRAVRGWKPDLARYGRPHFLAIADAIADDVASVVGSLPRTVCRPSASSPQRSGSTSRTVARGYVEAKRRGLIASRVGDGTVVAGRRSADWSLAAFAAAPPRRPALVDLSMNLPPEPDDPDLLGPDARRPSCRSRPTCRDCCATRASGAPRTTGRRRSPGSRGASSTCRPLGCSSAPARTARCSRSCRPCANPATSSAARR